MRELIRDRARRVERGDAGFTLIELLVVIVILAILAAIVVFAVGGITDKGQASACDTDLKTIQTAEEAYYGSIGPGGRPVYGTGQDLVTKGFLTQLPSLHQVLLVAGTDQQYQAIATGANNCTSPQHDYTSPVHPPQ
jgi:general secretion pathway protein G